MNYNMSNIMEYFTAIKKAKHKSSVETGTDLK